MGCRHFKWEEATEQNKPRKSKMNPEKKKKNKYRRSTRVAWFHTGIRPAHHGSADAGLGSYGIKAAAHEVQLLEC
ncbi:hypothetical protein LINPERPRIM_LOCUS7599 [Linum perenne]